MEGIFQMNILAINGSPRKQGNTSIIIREILEGAKSAGAETPEVRLHDIHLKGCMGCLSCRTDHGKCKQKDDLSPYLEAMKTCDGLIVGSPIYMYHITGQTKIFVDRAYSLYPPDEKGGYVLADRGTWLALKDKLNLTVVFEGDPMLVNQYGVMAVNPVKHPHVKYSGATAFISWLISDKGQKAIGAFKINGEQLFIANANNVKIKAKGG